MPSRKIFLRLSLFAVLYVSYLCAFSYFSVPVQIELDVGIHKTHNEELEKRKVVTPIYEDKICSNDDQLDAIMQEYLPLQNKHLDTIKTTGKFIVFSAIDDAGLGNRIPTLVSCFILSLLTDRGFLVHWPFVEESINSQDEHVGMVAFEKLFNTPFFMDSILHPDFYDSISVNSTKIMSMESLSNLLLCGDFESVYNDTRIVIIYGWRPFFDVLLRNKHYLDKVNKLNLASLVPAISQCLLRPIPLVQEIVNNFRQITNIGPHNKIIGVHIRKLSSHGLTVEQELALWDCVRAKYPPPPPPNYVQGWSNWNASVLYFLASDSPETVINAPPDFRPYIIMVRQTDGSRHTVEGLAHALADMWLLGQTEALFGGQGTTYLAAVRTLFAVPTQLVTWKARAYAQVDASQSHETQETHEVINARCVPVNMLPCYKWWDAFSSVNDFSLSCYLAHSGSSARDSHLC